MTFGTSSRPAMDPTRGASAGRFDRDAVPDRSHVFDHFDAPDQLNESTTIEAPEVPGTTTGQTPRGLRLGSAFGVPILVTPSWFVIILVVTTLSTAAVQRSRPDLDRAAIPIALVMALLLLFSVFVHELIHALTARWTGPAPAHIVLDLWGGHTTFESAFTTPGRSALVAAVGPSSNAVLALIGYFAERLFVSDASSLTTASTPGPSVAALLVQAFVYSNAFVAVFNALPGLPLDGGRILEAVIWKSTGSRPVGSFTAGWCGRAVVAAVALWFVLVPVVLGEPPAFTSLLWSVLICGMLWQGAGQAIKSAQWQRQVESITLSNLLEPARTVQDTWTVADVLTLIDAEPVSRTAPISRAAARARDRVTVAGERHSAANGRAGRKGRKAPALTSVPAAPELVVMSAGHPVALIDRAATAAVPKHRAASVSVVSVAKALPAHAVIPSTLASQDLITHLQSHQCGRYVVVGPDHDVQGTISWVTGASKA